MTHAYRFVAATGFALGPATLYLATREVASSRLAGILAAVAFVFAPAASYLITAIHDDAAAFSGTPLPPPWRLIALVAYGEGPHVLSLSFAFLTLAVAARYIRAPSARRLLAAVVAAVAVALTNLIGVVGAAVLVILLPASAPLGDAALSRWVRALRIGALAALLSASWYSVGFVRAVFGFSVGGTSDGAAYPFFIALLAAGIVAVAKLSRRVPAGLGLIAGACLVFAAVVIAWQIGGIALVPQPIRYLLELDAVVAMAIGIGVAAVVGRIRAVQRPGPAAALALAVGAAAIVSGVPGWAAVRDRLAPDEAWRERSEHVTAIWLAEHLAPGERAYLSGDHAFWLDVFADVPQVRGGHDYAGPHPWWAHVTFQVNSGSDADVSVLWMQALAVRYVVVTGPGSGDAFQDFADPAKFDGLLPLAFERGGARIFEVPRVGDPQLVVARIADLAPPANAIDRAAIGAYVQRIAAGHAATALERRGLGAWRADVDVDDGESVLLRQSYDAGWHAMVDGHAVTVRADATGQLLVPVPPGRHVVELDHRVHPDLLAGVAVAALTMLGLVLTAVRSHGVLVRPAQY